MKKVVIFISFISLFMIGCANKNAYDEITYSEFNNMINKKEDFILYIGAEHCSYCKSYTLTINRVIKNYNVKVYYIDMDKLTETEHNDFKRIINYTGTPTTVFINDGQEESIYNRVEGAKGYDKVVEKFKENNYIK